MNPGRYGFRIKCGIARGEIAAAPRGSRNDGGKNPAIEEDPAINCGAKYDFELCIL